MEAEWCRQGNVSREQRVAARDVKDTCGRNIGGKRAKEVARQGPCTTYGSCLALNWKIGNGNSNNDQADDQHFNTKPQGRCFRMYLPPYFVPKHMLLYFR